jgi:hypothetical protein
MRTLSQWLRCGMLAGAVLAAALSVGCGGSGAIMPKDELTPEAEKAFQKQIEDEQRREGAAQRNQPRDPEDQ